MRVLICPDKFKGSLTAREVIDSIRLGILQADPTAQIISQPLADGGEGSLSIVRDLFALQEHRLEVTGPLRRPVMATYLMGDGVAYIESASACGLQLVPPHRRDPGFTTTIGVGQLIEDALARGAKEINLFLGGSATNDGGVGMAAALGYQFFSDRGNDFVPSGDSLGYVTKVDASGVGEVLKKATVRAICDVRNPLLGPNGATYVYAVQKGATVEELPVLENNLSHLDAVLEGVSSQDTQELPGAGAAGGLGYGAAVFLGAELISGSDWLMDAVNLRGLMQEADLVITGEGKVDRQTLSGKVVAGVGRLGLELGVPVWAVAGVNELGQAELPAGVARVLALVDLPGVTVGRAVRGAGGLLVGLVAGELSSDN
ncbi:glycerate kinase [Neolewinella antarctica]|uniref:Glycerate kinase n=1 Tax=Neolewinella antarctica TaxID=442734 RepID=A0ABX0XB85_9BACT|nr:glycerate kinase [Neolewinella antarctica]NJC26472.1 glycerate kinase [Neolewinella antarctica]